MLCGNKLRALAAVLIVTTVAAFAAQQDLPWRARTLVAELAAREFDRVEAQFDSTMHSLLPEKKLSETWDGVIAQAGEFNSILGTRPEELQGYRIVVVTCRFAKRTQDIRLVFDSWGQITGLFFVPVKTQSSTAETAANPVDVTGDWLGTLQVGATRLRFIFHISKTADGLKATLDSPDENASGLPVSSVEVNGSAVTLEAKG
ncbi:MAG TPA: DUF3887 domain-containing protein [Candidatus Angelobacter sp.]